MTAIRCFVFGCCFIVAAAGRSHAEERVFSDTFDGRAPLKWKVIRKVESHRSLEKHPGCLTITTQRGTIHGDETNDAFSEGTQAKNIHLLEKRLPNDSDFVATLTVKKFQPEVFYHQVALIAYRDDDNYVKWSMEQSNGNPPTTKTVLVCEKQARPSHHLITDIEIDGPFALRLERFGDSWICSHSLDGEAFQVVGIQEWPLDKAVKPAPLRIGFLAKNGGNPKAPEIEIQFDAFELKLPDAAKAAAK